MPSEIRVRQVHLDGRTITLFGKPYRWHTGYRQPPRLERLPGVVADHTPYDPHGLLTQTPCDAWLAAQQHPDGDRPGTTEEEAP